MQQPRGTTVTIFASVVVACAALLLSPESSGPLVAGWSLLCALLIFQSSKNLSPSNRWCPTTLTAIFVAITLGNVIRAVESEPSLSGAASYADLLQLPAFIGVGYVAWRLLRARALRRDIDAWLDAAAIALGTFIVLWLAFLGRFMLSPDTDPSTLVLNGLYNISSFVAFAIAMRIAATPGRRPFAYRLIGLAYFTGFLTDVSAALSIAEGTGPRIAIALSPITMGLTAAALRHETANDIFSRHVEEVQSLGSWRVLVIGIASMTPVLYLIDGRSQTAGFKFVAVTAAALLAFSVFFRIFRLLQAERGEAERDRLLAAELSHLSSSSPEAISNRIPEIAMKLCPGTSARLTNIDHHGYTSIALDEVLTIEGRDRLLVLPSSGISLPPAETRSLGLLALNAGHIAQTSKLSSIEAQRASDAAVNQRIAINEQRFRALVQNATDVIAVMNPTGEVTYISESCEKLLGYPTERFLGNNLEWVAHENDWGFARDYLRATLSGTESTREHEVRALHANGSVRLLECFITDMRDVEGVDGLVINVTDVTEKRTLERHLRDAETTDALTLLLNRNAFIREADAAIRRSSVSNNGVAMAIINLDDFRLINEGYGTTIADELLIELSHRVRQAVRSEDSVARLNGDEFGILMPGGYSSVEAANVVERILEEFTEPVDVAGSTIVLRATAGLVMNSDDSVTGISLLRDADTALDAAKQTNRGGLLQFEDAMGEEVSERVLLRNMLNDAIQTDQLRLAFQPIVDMETGSIVSMEALSRWHHGDRGDIPPSTFIPIAEATGMISELGEWALRTACMHVVAWAEHGFDDFTVSVNMSGHQLREENMISEVKGVLDETGVDPSRMTIEITESVLIDDTDFIAERIRALRDLGLRLAIDDFGTGYSSLSYLRRYEFDVLKIDRSFVVPLANDINKREREIVNAMIKLAQALGAVTVAEGIEENEEYAVLRTLGCDYAQGFLFWHPIEGNDVLGVLDQQSADRSAA